jgi:hypothetical protein
LKTESKRFSWLVAVVAILVLAALLWLCYLFSFDYGEDLRKAAYIGDVQTVRAVLSKHPSIIDTFRESPEVLMINGKGRGNSRRVIPPALFAKLHFLWRLLKPASQYNIWDEAGYSALDLAVRGRQPEVVSVLLDNGADGAHLSAENAAALHMAIQLAQVQIVQLFLDHNVDLNLKDRSGSTPLGWAVLCQFKEIAELLIAHGADVNGGDTPPLLWAVMVRSKPMAELLIQHGAKVDLADKGKRTPLSEAVRNRDSDLATFLREHGARE